MHGELLFFYFIAENEAFFSFHYMICGKVECPQIIQAFGILNLFLIFLQQLERLSEGHDSIVPFMNFHKAEGQPMIYISFIYQQGLGRSPP